MSEALVEGLRALADTLEYRAEGLPRTVRDRHLELRWETPASLVRDAANRLEKHHA